MLKIKIDQNLMLRIPKLSLGVVFSEVKVTKYDEKLWKEINKEVDKISSSLDMESLYNIDGIKSLREGYRAIGKDPTRYRGSAEALARRIIQGKGLYKVNTIVDINNLISLETMNSVGSYDLSKIGEDVTFRIGKPNEEYKGIGKEIINISELPVFADEFGPFGSPTSDSERAMITEDTKDLMIVVISFLGNQSLEKYLNRVSDLLISYSGATKDKIKTLIV